MRTECDELRLLDATVVRKAACLDGSTLHAEEMGNGNKDKTDEDFYWRGILQGGNVGKIRMSSNLRIVVRT